MSKMTLDECFKTLHENNKVTRELEKKMLELRTVGTSLIQKYVEDNCKFKAGDIVKIKGKVKKYKIVNKPQGVAFNITYPLSKFSIIDIRYWIQTSTGKYGNNDMPISEDNLELVEEAKRETV